jgi:CubicO group peptidase (beta-lactamase class C family)
MLSTPSINSVACGGQLTAAIFFVALVVAPTARAQNELPRSTPETVGVSGARLQRIGHAIQRHIDEKHISGAVALVARKGFVVHYEAYGLKDIDSKKPMTRDTIFKMASSTKPVTGVAIMMLVEEGRIHLADPVSRFIPAFKEMKVAVEKEGSSEIDFVKAAREITVRDLLTHGSGLLSGGAGSKQAPRELLRPAEPGETLARFIPRLATIPLDFQPGTKWRYSGLAGIDTLANRGDRLRAIL